MAYYTALLTQSGVKAMEKAAQILLKLGCDVSIVAIPRPGERPDGWDIADLQKGAIVYLALSSLAFVVVWVWGYVRRPKN